MANEYTKMLNIISCKGNANQNYNISSHLSKSGYYQRRRRRKEERREEEEEEKEKRKNWGWGMVQVVEHLPSMHEALGLINSTTKMNE
jgi:hypothetical protein